MKVAKNHHKDKWGRLMRRRMRIRRRVNGTPERPRLHVRKTNRHLYVTVHDDSVPGGGVTLLAMGTAAADAGSDKNHSNIASAKALGAAAAKALAEKGCTQIVFDRGGSRYHGCIKALCDALRENGINV